MDKILELKQKRAAVISKMKNLAAMTEKENRSLTEEEKNQWQEWKDEAARMADDIVREEELRSLEGEEVSPLPAENSQHNLPVEVRLGRFFKVAMLSTRDNDSPERIAERIYPEDAELRAVMQQSVPKDGGVLVPENLSSEIIPFLKQECLTRKLGAKEIPLINGNINIPRQTGAALFKWVGENKPIGNSGATFELLKFKGKTLCGIIPVTNELLNNASIYADEFIFNEVVTGIAEAEDISCLYGSGSEDAPSGITVACVANKIEAGARVSRELLVNMVGKMKQAKLNNPKLAWRFPGILWPDLYLMKDENGRNVYAEEMDKGMLNGIPFVLDNNITIGSEAHAVTQIFLGDWTQFIIGAGHDLVIDQSKEASFTVQGKLVSAFENKLTLFRATQTEDFGVRYKEAFVFADNVWTADV